MKRLLAGIALLVAVGCGTVHDHAAFHAMMEELKDRNDVVAAANRLFICTDNKDWTCVRDVFAPEVFFDMTSLGAPKAETKTPEQIAGMWEQGLRPIQAIHHQSGNYEVEVRGNEADLFCYGTAWHYLPNPTERNTRIFIGSYNEHFVRTEKGWKMDRFRFNLKFIDGNKDLEGSKK